VQQAQFLHPFAQVHQQALAFPLGFETIGHVRHHPDDLGRLAFVVEHGRGVDFGLARSAIREGETIGRPDVLGAFSGRGEGFHHPRQIVRIDRLLPDVQRHHPVGRARNLKDSESAFVAEIDAGRRVLLPHPKTRGVDRQREASLRFLAPRQFIEVPLHAFAHGPRNHIAQHQRQAQAEPHKK